MDKQTATNGYLASRGIPGIDKHNTLLLPITNIYNHMTTGYVAYAHAFKGYVFGKKEGGAWLYKRGKVSEMDLYLFESPLDAYAYMYIHKADGIYMATLGNPSRLLLDGFAEFLASNYITHMYVCTDNDDAGRRIGQRLVERAGGVPVTWHHPPAYFKDWNELLQGAK